MLNANQFFSFFPLSYLEYIPSSTCIDHASNNRRGENTLPPGQEKVSNAQGMPGWEGGCLSFDLTGTLYPYVFENLHILILLCYAMTASILNSECLCRSQ